MADQDRSFDPTSQQVDRGREQGLGVGETEPGQRRGPAGDAPVLDGVSANPEEDWGEPADPGATYSANHTRRPAKTEADRSQGPKTRKAAKDQISRRPT